MLGPLRSSDSIAFALTEVSVPTITDGKAPDGFLRELPVASVVVEEPASHPKKTHDLLDRYTIHLYSTARVLA
jgi:hypothetical protein